MEESRGRIYYGIGLDNTDLKNGANEARNILHDIGDSAEEEGERLDSVFKKIGQTAATVFAASTLKDFVKNVATVRGEFQQLEMAFKTMLGSEEKADNLMSQLIQTAATTPFGMSDIAQASKQLLAYGVEAEDVNETLIRLGDIAAGLSIPIGDLAYLYGTTMVQGRLFTQDLRQFTGRGIPLTEELAKQFGVTKDKVSALVTEGKVGFPEVQQAIISLTSEGGKFGGLMAAQSQTITGQISNIEDAIEQMFNELGKRSEGVISDTLGVVSELVENWETVGKVLLVVISTYGAYKAAVLAVAAAHKVAAIWGEVQAFLSLTKCITSAKDAMLLLNMATKANPIGLVLSAVAAAATAFVLFRDKSDDATDALKRQQQEAEDFNRAVSESAGRASSQYRQLQNEYKTLKNAHEKTEWIDKNKSKFSELGLSVNNVNSAENIFVKNTEIMLAAFKKRAEASAWQSKLNDAYAQRIERQMKLEEQASKINAGTASRSSSHTTEGGNEIVDRNGKWVYTEKGAAAARKALLENDVTLKGLDALIDKYAAKVQALGNEYSDALKEAGADTKTEPTKEEKAAAEKAAKEAQKLADDAAARMATREKNTSAAAMAEREAQLEIRQGAINGMKEGYDKQIKQNELEYDRLMLANDKRREQMLNAYKDEQVSLWLDKNPKATKEQELAYRATITELPEKQTAMLDAYAQVAADIQVRKNKEALDDMLADVLDYEQQREKVVEQFSEKRKQLYIDGDSSKGLKEGVTQGNVDEINYDESKALAAIDEEFASREESFSAWCEAIADLSLKQLEAVLQKAQDELKALESAGDKDSQKIATARSKVAKAQDAINKASAKQKLGVEKRTLKEWEDLYKTLDTCCSQFEKLGDTVGGVAGEVINTAGNIAGSTLSMINGIVQLVNMSSAGMQGTAVAAATAISTVEKASVILTVISAAIQIAMTIVSLFNSDEKKQEQIDALQKEIDRLQWQIDNADLVRIQQNFAKAVDMTAAAYAHLSDEILAATFQTAKSLDSASFKTAVAAATTEVLQKKVQELATAYGNVAYTADKALGSAKYDSARNSLENMSQQMMLIQGQINLENDKKKSDSDAIAEYEQKLEELGLEMATLINEMVEDIIGGSAQDIASELGDAFFEAFQDGEDYAEAWGDKVNDIVADVIKRMLISQFLEAPLGEIFDKYKQKWFKDGNFQGIDSVIGSMQGFANDLNAVGDDFTAIWENLPDSVKNMFTVTSGAEREASEKGIASASQDSIDELNGRMTAVQGHTYSISENTKILVSNTGSILSSVLAIEQHTERLAAMEYSMKAMRDSLNDIAIKGVKIK